MCLWLSLNPHPERRSVRHPQTENGADAGLKPGGYKLVAQIYWGPVR